MIHNSQCSRNILILSLRYLRDTKFIYVLEMISIMLVFCIVEIVMFFMNGLQNDQLNALKEVSSFPLIVENLTQGEAKKLKEDLLNLELIDSAYVYKDEYLYTSNGNTYNAYIERTIDREFFNNTKFLKHFIYFPSDIRFFKGELYAIPNTLYFTNDGSNAITLNNGESGGITITSKAIKNVVPYYSCSYLSAPEIIFISLREDVFDLSNYKLGIYDFNCSEKQLINTIKTLNNNTIFSSYKAERTDIYSALMIERYFLTFVMFILVVLLFLSFKKTMNNMIDEKENEFIILKVYGLSNKELKYIFLLTLYIPMVLSAILGVLLGALLTHTKVLENIVSLLFKEMDNFVFIANYGAMVLFSAVAMIIPLLLILSSSKKIENISIIKGKDEE